MSTSGSMQKKKRRTRSKSQLTKAEQQAIQAREAQHVADPVTAAPVESPAANEEVVSKAGRTVKRRVLRRPAALSREMEYAIIRNDMQRLLIIAGTLLVGMLAMLVVVD